MPPPDSAATAGLSLLAQARVALAAGLRATNPAATFDLKGYVTDISMNLAPGISLDAVGAEFGAGAGNELAGKMRAPWSSSALVVNSFAPWRGSEHDLSVAGVAGLSTDFAFEAKCPNGVARTPPHLDVLFTHGDEVVAVEAKLLEYLTPKSRVPAAAYLALEVTDDPRAFSQWFEVLTHLEEFHHLDAYQLVKHYLGLRLTYPRQPLTLVYLFWEPAKADAAPAFALHRTEIEAFAEMVAGDSTCAFRWQSYPEHWSALSRMENAPTWLADNLAWLRARYLVSI